MIGIKIQLTQNKSEGKLHLIKMVHLRLCWLKDFRCCHIGHRIFHPPKFQPRKFQPQKFHPRIFHPRTISPHCLINHPVHFTTITQKLTQGWLHALTVGLVELEKYWDWVRFCSLSLTKSNPTNFIIFFKTKFPFQALTESDTHCASHKKILPLGFA